MKQITVRNVSPQLAQALNRARKNRGTSLNQTVIDLLKLALGLNGNEPVDNGLKKLAGTWTKDEHAEFEKNTSFFGQIDKELWQ